MGARAAKGRSGASGWREAGGQDRQGRVRGHPAAQKPMEGPKAEAGHGTAGTRGRGRDMTAHTVAVAAAHAVAHTAAG